MNLQENTKSKFIHQQLLNILYWEFDYRYSFNGKEKDDEISGNGNIYDYGFRIYNARLGKFLSTDPLSGNYPWYTPYQFAGNKPIWAIDIDGLEEWIYVYEFDAETQTATLIEKKHNVSVQYQQQWTSENTMTTTKTYTNKSTGETMKPMQEGTTTGEMGTVQYQYKDKEGNVLNVRRDYNGDYVSGDNEVMPLGQNNMFGSIYIGPDNPTAVVNGKKIPDYRREPLDELDVAAYNHDKGYDEKGAVGASDAWSNLDVLPVDQQLVSDAEVVLKKYRNGGKDSKTGQPISDQEGSNAKLVKLAFMIVVGHKYNVIRQEEQNARLKKETQMFLDSDYMNSEGWSRITTGQN
ncbi:MAG: RHS repeat-associated core domain-containing protein [Crocinitomicaceae bacterium]|nr:hypothetical protein [Crocinitomicaceae bacterium]